MKQIRELQKELTGMAEAIAGHEHDARFQSWAKTVTAVGKQANGYAFDGDFIKDGTVEHEVKPTVFLVMTASGSRKYQTRYYNVITMNAEGDLMATDIQANSKTSGWALRIREQVRALVDEISLAVDPEDVEDGEAIVAFLGTMDRCRDHLVILNQVVEGHLGLAPERVNWSAVGDARRLRSQLSEIVTWTRPLVMSKDEADRLIEEGG